MSNPHDDKRRDEVIKRMLQTPPKKQAEFKKELKEQRRPKVPKRAGSRDPSCPE